MNIATIINYCTKDYRFLDLCLKEAAAFSEQLIVPVCDHFFNGTPENQKMLQRSYKEHPNCLFVEYAYDPKLPYGIYCPFKPEDDDWAHYWHSTSRYVGYHFLKPEIDYVLFLDVDEIVESHRLLKWLQNFPVASYNALRFLSYFYFRQPQFRAKSFSLNALLIKREALASPEVLLTIYERKGVFDAICGKKMSSIAGLDDKPLVHHYSWVRKEEELHFKASCWGHCKEKDWQSLLKEEFSQEFRGKDCLYGLEYETVEALHDPFNLETAVEPSKEMQYFESETLPKGADHSQKVKAAPFGNVSGSKDCVYLPDSTAVSRFKEPILPKSKNKPVKITPRKLLKLQIDITQKSI